MDNLNFTYDLSMNKTLSHMAQYLQNLLPTGAPANYSIKPIFANIEREENIRRGVFAFKDFMSLIYELLINDGKRYEKPGLMTRKSGRNPSLAVDFPFIYHVRSVLFNIGYHSILGGEALTFSGLKTLAPVICCEGMEATTKISAPKLISCLRFLNECGMYFEGFDLDAEKPCMASQRLIEVTYPDNPDVFTGLKIMAIAQRDLPWKTNDEIFLRCDYNALSNEDVDAMDALKNLIRPLPSEIQEQVIHLHQKSMENGLSCTVKTGLKNSFTYARKKNVLWEMSSSFANGYQIFASDEQYRIFYPSTTAPST